jgi:hypothetical protein
MHGFGFPGQGFYSLTIPWLDQPKKKENVGLLRITTGRATAEWVEEELEHMFDGKWKWMVRKISDNEFLAVFPTKEILDTFSKSKSINFALHNITTVVSKSEMDPSTSSVLQTGWVKLIGIPSFARNVEAVKPIAELGGS